MKLVILGAGGHGKTVAEAARLSEEYEFVGFLDPKPGEGVIDSDEDLTPYRRYAFIVGVGSIGDPTLRIKVYERALESGLESAVLIHPASTIALGVDLGHGSFVAPGVIIDPGVTIGANVILNVGALVCHDSWVGNHVHLSPGSILCGNVRVGEKAHVGAGATILQNVTIGARAIVGAGAVVHRDVAEGATVVGVPAKVIGVKV